MIFSKILSILSPAHTLPPLRDDLAVPQHHPYQMPRLADPSYLAKRQIPTACLYWDRQGRIKAVFKLSIDFIVGDILEHQAINLAHSVLSELVQFVYSDTVPVGPILTGAAWAAQLGENWQEMIQRSRGEITVGILITRTQRYYSRQCTYLMLSLLEYWFAQYGFGSYAVPVQDAARAGNVGPRDGIEELSITERQTVEARTVSKFCQAPMQNWPFVLAAGELDKLLIPLITC